MGETIVVGLHDLAECMYQSFLVQLHLEQQRGDLALPIIKELLLLFPNSQQLAVQVNRGAPLLHFTLNLQLTTYNFATYFLFYIFIFNFSYAVFFYFILIIRQVAMAHYSLRDYDQAQVVFESVRQVATHRRSYLFITYHFPLLMRVRIYFSN